MKNYLFITLICLSLGCKKKSDSALEPTPTTNTTDWSGTYSLTSLKCTLPAYQDVAASVVSLPSTSAFVFAAGSFNTDLDTSVTCAIQKSTSAQISSDAMTSHDLEAGYNSWDFMGGTITKSNNTLTFSYSFKIFDATGKLTANPVYTVVYQK